MGDGVEALVGDGTGIKGRVAILGGSYGGYAALAGLAFTPDLYAAGICLFGISDLNAHVANPSSEWQPFAGDNYATCFKMKLGIPGTACIMRGKPATARDLTRDFLAYVREYIEQTVVYASINSIILTVPAIFGPAQRKDLKDAAKDAGFTKVELLDEPVAAAIGYCNRCPEQWDGQRLLVVDWGGGTLDIALVERRAGGELRVQVDFVSGLCDIGGEILDDDLWALVSKRLATAGHGPLEDQAPENLGKYKRDLRLAKEQLSAKEHHALQLIVAGGRHLKIELSRTDFEGIIAPRLEQAAAMVKEIHARSLKEGCEPDFILLVGGTCRIPAVKKIIEQATGVPCKYFDYGREAVALGAAVKAHREWGNHTPGSPAITPDQDVNAPDILEEFENPSNKSPFKYNPNKLPW